jgi:hypothetical protein
MRRGSPQPESPRPASSGSTVRSIIGVGPGTRAVARLSPIAPTRSPVGDGPEAARPIGPGAPPGAPRPLPPAAPRPMHPPIARVAHPGLSATALQASAAAVRPGPGTPASRADRAAGGAPRAGGAGRLGFGMPSLRRNVCPHFFMTGARGAIPIQAPHLLKALVRQEANVSRCQLRGGVHMEQGYVNDVCLSARFNQCVFYEDELAR